MSDRHQICTAAIVPQPLKMMHSVCRFLIDFLNTLLVGIPTGERYRRVFVIAAYIHFTMLLLAGAKL